MGNVFILYTALAVFGIGVTIIDFLGILDHAEGRDAEGRDGVSGSHDSGHGGHAGDYADGGGPDGHDSSGAENAEHYHGSYLSPGDAGIKAVTVVMGLLRTAVYFSLGFGPTGLFAWFTGISRTAGLVWACAVGTAMAVFARLLRRLLRRDLDSSIRPDEFLMETGVLLLPLEGGQISKLAVRQFGRETELYVRCRDTAVKLSRGKTVRIVEYDNDVYWVEPLE
jgi:hypothetical protein